MIRFNTALLFIAGLGVTACQPPSQPQPDDALAKLTKRVEALETQVKQLGRAAPQRPQRPDPALTYYLPVHQDDPYRGAEHAKVTIVEAYEFACPYCAMIEPALAGVVEAFEGTDMVKVVSKQFVVHPQLATDPALAVCAAHKQGKFAPFASLLWKKSWDTSSGRPRMQRDQLGRTELTAMAKTVGIDADQFTKDLDSADCKAKLQRDRTELARIGVRGTPYIFINGRYYTGGRTAEALKQAVEAEAKKADQALAKGTQLADYYPGLMKTARRKL